MQTCTTDVDRRLEMMDKGKIVLAALDPSTQLMGYDLKGEQPESWCRLYNECVKVFIDQYAGHGRSADPGTGARRQNSGSRSHPARFRGAYIATNVNHRYYDSEDFDPFWAKAQA